MAKRKSGFIKVSHDFLNHPLYSDGTAFSLKEVLLDLNLRALYQDTQKTYRNRLHTYLRGQVEGSMRQFADWWCMSVNTASRRLEALEECGFVQVINVQGRTVVNLLEYCTEQDNSGLGWNSDRYTDEYISEETHDTIADTQTDTTLRSNKKDIKKSIKNQKEMPAAHDFCVGGRIYEE